MDFIFPFLKPTLQLISKIENITGIPLTQMSLTANFILVPEIIYLLLE